jgi:hypothetical protein
MGFNTCAEAVTCDEVWGLTRVQRQRLAMRDGVKHVCRSSDVQSEMGFYMCAEAETYNENFGACKGFETHTLAPVLLRI